jgi:hypothetical protein
MTRIFGGVTFLPGENPMRPKHPKDGNHGKRGWVSGNPRYSRAKADQGKNKTMGKN